MRPGFWAARSRAGKWASDRAKRVVRSGDLRSAGPGCQAKYRAVFLFGHHPSENRTPLFGMMPSARLLLAGAGSVGLQRPDALGERPAALGNAARGRAIGR